MWHLDNVSDGRQCAGDFCLPEPDPLPVAVEPDPPVAVFAAELADDLADFAEESADAADLDWLLAELALVFWE